MRIPESKPIEISTATLIKGMLVLLGFVFLYLVRDVIAILLTSVVLASAAEPGIRKLERWGLPRVAGVVVIYLSILALFGLVFYFLIPPILGDLSNFVTSFPVYLENALRTLQRTFTFIPIDAFSTSVAQAALSLNTLVSNNIHEFFSPASFFGGATAFIFVLVVSFYLAVQDDGVGNFLRIVTPYKHESYIADLWVRAQHKIGRWFQGQILLGVLVAVLVYLGLTLLGVNSPLVLAILAGLLEIIPYFGPVLSAIPGVALATIQSPILGFWVLLLLSLIHI